MTPATAPAALSLHTLPLSTSASHALSALSPCLSVSRPSREARRASQALDRLLAALSLAASANVALLDPGAVADVSHALRDVLEVSARAAVSLRQRPRIRTGADARAKDAAPPRANLGPPEKRRLDVAANRIDTVVQVALWKHRDSLKGGGTEDRRNARVPRDDDSSRRHRGRLGRKGRLFSTGDMKGRKPPEPLEPLRTVPPNQDVVVVVQERGKPTYAPQHKPSERTLSEGGAPNTLTRQESALRALASLRAGEPALSTADAEQEKIRPWEFSLVESPITPLRSRTLASVEDGKVVMAMWRGVRVSVKVIRRDRARFYREGDYLFALGQSPNIPSLLGGHWEHANKGKKNGKKSSSSNGVVQPVPGGLDGGNGNVGYLVLEVANGVSLDKLVRDGKLTDTVSQIRLLDRVVAALVYAQKIDPAITHQDIHPGNILLVPSATVTSTITGVAASSNGRAGMTNGVMDTDSSSNSSSAARNGISLKGMTATMSNSTVGVSDKSTADESSTAVNVLVRDELLSELPEGDIIIDEFGSPQKTGVTQNFMSKVPVRSSTATGPKFPPRNLPQIPKVEEVKEALTVLERVALHNELDASVGADVGQKKRNGKAKNLAPLSVKPSLVQRPGKLYRSSTTMPSTDNRTNSNSFVSEGPGKDDPPKSSDSLVSTALSFTVKVMDFAPAHEADGMRKWMSWLSNESIAGYCPPEKVSANMWRKMHHARERERERERDRERRAMVARGASNGRHSPRPPPRRRSSNGIGGNMGILGARSGSGSNSRRKAFDSETYALFGDDHLDDFADADEDPNYDSTGQGRTSVLADRSGRRVAARGPDVLRDELRSRPARLDGVENGRHYAGRSSTDGIFSRKDALLEDGIPMRAWSRSSEGNTNEDGAGYSRMSKIDVWSVGWLLYYMATGKHPPADSWAKQSYVNGKDFRDIAPEARQIIQMCIQRDLNKRACMRDVKRHIDSILQGLMFGKGLALLETDRRAAFVLLDKAVGIKSSRIRGGKANVDATSRSASTSMTASISADVSGGLGTIVTNAEARSLGDGSKQAMKSRTQRVIGLNQRTRVALACLPLVVVRRVEWEAAARYLQRSSEELLQLRRALVGCRWTKADVVDGAAAVSYLSKRAEEGVTSAQSALGWIHRWGAGGVKKNVAEAMRLWECAVTFDDPEAANGLGLIFHHGREQIPVDGPRARAYYERAVAQGYPAAAVNLGVMLHDGAAGLPVNGEEARRLYQVAVAHGDAIAANNLGLLLQHGARGLKRDAGAAVKMYELAIARGERHHACRNLGELLWNGAEGVPRARANAVEYFRQAVERGDEASRRTARARLRKLVACLGEEEPLGKALAERCWKLVEGGRR